MACSHCEQGARHEAHPYSSPVLGLSAVALLRLTGIVNAVASGAGNAAPVLATASAAGDRGPTVGRCELAAADRVGGSRGCAV